LRRRHRKWKFNVIVCSSSLVDTTDVIAKLEGESGALRWRKVVLIGLILIIVMVIVVVVKTPSTKDSPGMRWTRGWIMLQRLGGTKRWQRQPSYHPHWDISQFLEW
jgi:hypothetical protein